MMHARPRLAFDPRVSCSWRDVWPCVHVRGETAVLHEGLTLLEDIVGDLATRRNATAGGLPHISRVSNKKTLYTPVPSYGRHCTFEPIVSLTVPFN